MTKQPHYFAIGLFILVALGLAIAGVIVLGGNALSAPRNYIETYVNESVQGVDVGTPFKFRGVKIGSISEISIVSTEYDTDKMYVLMRVALDENALPEGANPLFEQVDDMVARGLRVRLVPLGITGLSFLEADYFEDLEEAPLPIDWTPKVTYIPSKPGLLTRVGNSMDRLTYQLERIHLGKIAGNIEQMSSNLNAAVTEDFTPLLHRVEERLDSMEGTFENLDRIMQSAAEEVPPILANARIATDRLPQISSNLTTTVDQLAILVEENSGEIDEIITNIKYITDDTRQFIRMIKEYPGMLLTEPPEKLQ